MATLRRCHAPKVWGAHIDIVVWEKLQAGKQRCRRSNKPPLAYDPGWDWDGNRIVLNEETATPDWEERAGESQEELREQNVPSSQRKPENLSLSDVARYPVEKRHGKARATFGDFEVIRVPKVVPILEEPEFGGDWYQDEWEKVEVVSFKRMYSEVVRSAIEVEGRDPPG